MKLKSSVLLSLALLFFIKNMSIAYGNSEKNELKVSSESSERIEVFGQKPLSLYRKELRLREKEFIEALNELVDNPDMETHCEMQAANSFTKMRKRVCKPRFVSQIHSEEKQKAIRRDGSFRPEAVFQAMVNRADVHKKIEGKRDELADKIFELVDANPELMKKYQSLQKAKLDYEANK